MILGASPGGERIQGVLFDYGLTLVTFVRPQADLQRAYAEVSAVLDSAGVRPVPSPATLLRRVHDRIEGQVARHEDAGRLDELDIVTLERSAYARLGAQLSDELLDEVTERVQRAWWAGITVPASTVPVLETLRAQGLRVGLCSNAPYRFMHDQLRHLGLDSHFDSVTFSREVGRRKPAPEIFAAALRELGVEAGRCVMVGDRRREDVAGGRAVGMLTIRVREHRDDAGPGDADHVIDRLSDLPDLVSSGHGSDKRGSVDDDGKAPGSR